MRRLLAAFALAALTWTAPASAQFMQGGITVVTSACPNAGTASADGCAGANQNGNFKQSTLLTANAASGQTLAFFPAWNIAGKDYPVSYDKTLSLQNPSVASLPTGCAYLDSGTSPTASTATGARHTGPTLSCGGTGQSAFTGGTLSGMDFTQNSCTWLYFGASASGTATIKNNHFGSGSNCDGDSASGVALLGGSFAGALMSITFTNNEVEELYNKNTVKTNLINAFFFGNKGTSGSHCASLYQYNYIHDLNGNFAAGKNDFCTLDLQFNVYTNFNLGPSSHGAFFANTPTAGTAGTHTVVDRINQQYDICIYTTAATAGQGTTCFSMLGTQNGFTDYTVTNTDHDTIITNKAGGNGSATVSAAISAVQRPALITNVYISNNYVDPTGATGCFTNNGDTQVGLTGSVDNGGGSAGSTLTVTGGSGAFYVGSLFGNPTGDVAVGYVAPYGTNSTTGTGAMSGTYALYTTPTGTTLISTLITNAANYGALNSYVANLNGSSSYPPSAVVGGISMITGNPVTITGPKWNTGSCS